jgi:tRNA threonylcarbamoyladenosine biosynthesis protein TsaB
MTRLLAVETSAEVCSVALHVDGQVRSFFEHAPMRHAELLLPAVSGLLSEAELALNRLDAIAFGRGPGSFTSLRIGIGVIQGLAWGADLPVVPVSSLAAVAQQAADRGAGKHSAVCVAMDARMQEVYTASFSVSENLVQVDGEERVCRPEQVTVAGDDFIAAGNGFDRFPGLGRLAADAGACYPEIWPQAESICTLALEWLRTNKPLPAREAQPTYVRNDVAAKPGGVV